MYSETKRSASGTFLNILHFVKREFTYKVARPRYIEASLKIELNLQNLQITFYN